MSGADSTVLALKYRPLSFAGVVGQEHVKPILRAMTTTERVPPALLFSGTRGTGKTTSARIFAAALNCLKQQDGDACGECASCVAVQNGNSPSVLEIDAASSGGVDDVRRIKDLCLYTHEGRWQVVILDEAHSMSREAYNALLKLLEEPPAKTVVVMVTTEPEKILGTVRSRTMPFEFRRLRNSEVVDRLRFISDTEGFGAEDQMLLEAAEMAQGGLRDAVMVLDQVSYLGVQTAEQFRGFFGIQNYSVQVMWAAIRGDYAEGARLVREHFSRTGEAAGMVSDLSRLVTDLLVIKSDGRPSDLGEEALGERVEMANAVPTDSLVRVCEILWDLRTRTRATENDQRSAMEMGFALIARNVSAFVVPPSQPILQTEEVAPAVLTLAEMQKMS